MIYRGIPYLSFFNTESKIRKIEKIFFVGPIPIFLKTFITNPKKPFLKKVIDSLINHPELVVKKCAVFIKDKNIFIGRIPEAYKFIIKNNLIALDVIKSEVEDKKFAVIGLDYIHQTWCSNVDSEIIEIGVDSEIKLPKKGITFKIRNLIEANDLLRLVTHAKLNTDIGITYE
jgi:hypothetical protein